jgi:DsbC/DsbD-like thiol-disulfide interchange protein
MPLRGKAVRSVLVFVGVGLAAGGEATAQTGASRHVRASLLAETAAVRPGQALTLGIRLEMARGWHTYWRNPGDAGLPTRARWELPEGFAAGEIRWPRPIRFRTGPVQSYGYENDVLLLVEVRVPPSLAGREARLAGRVDWLECEVACIPGRADLSLVLPVRTEAPPGPHAPLFAEARVLLPAKDPGWRFAASPAGDGLSLTIRPPRGEALSEAYFYPVTQRLLDYAQTQELSREGAAWRLRLPLDPNGAPATRLEGVLAGETGRGTVAVEVEVPLASGPPRTSTGQERKP